MKMVVTGVRRDVSTIRVRMMSAFPRYYSSILLSVSLWCVLLISPVFPQSVTTLQSTSTLLTAPPPIVVNISSQDLPSPTIAVPSPTSSSPISRNINESLSLRTSNIDTVSSTQVAHPSFTLPQQTPPNSTVFSSSTSALRSLSSTMAVEVQPTGSSSASSNTRQPSISSLQPMRSSTPIVSVPPSVSLNSLSSSPTTTVDLSPTQNLTDQPSISLPLSTPSPSPPSMTITSSSMTITSLRILPTQALTNTNSSTTTALGTSSATETPGPGDNNGQGGVQTEVVVGVIVGIALFVAVLLAVVTLSCYICCRSRKYEYNTGNEFRVTVQHWKANSDHYTVNRSETGSLSSSRGSSLMSSFGLRPKVRGRYGSTPADRVTTVVNPEFLYSTPL